MIRRHHLLILLATVCTSSLRPFAPLTFYQPYDINLRTPIWEYSDGSIAPFKIGTSFEIGSGRNSRNFASDKSQLLRLYDHSENAIAMIQGFPDGSPLELLAEELLFPECDEVDDPNRGRVIFEGKFEGFDINFYAVYYFSLPCVTGHFDIEAYLPYKKRAVVDVTQTDLTSCATAKDRFVKNNITSNLDAIAKEFGDLCLGDASKTGLGDLIVLAGWQNDFHQYRKSIKKVRVTIRAGMTFPIGGARDINQAFSLPLGFDGAHTMPIMGALEVFFPYHLRAGMEFELRKWFDHTQEYRMKTNREQTDFLLLSRARARKKFGITWRFNLYTELNHVLGGLSARLAYRFFTNGEDRLWAKTNDFNEEIVNSAQSIKDWTHQALLFQLTYDFNHLMPDSWIKPQLLAFYKLPVGRGRRIIDPDTWGAQLVLNF